MRTLSPLTARRPEDTAADGRGARRSVRSRVSSAARWGPWDLGNPRASLAAHECPRYRARAVATFAVKFLGCKVSQADAMLARGALLAAGHTEAPEDEAELHVINTCCITSEAEAKSRQSVRRSLRDGPDRGVRLGLRGEPPRRPVRRDRRPRDAVRRARPRTSPTRWRPTSAPASTSSTTCSPASPPSQAARTRGFVKVQDGCDCHCAYCIIPTVRGPARSRPASAVLDEVAPAGRAGPAGDGDDRDQRRRLPRPRARPRARRADGRGRPGARASSASGCRASR